jgi:hypothetical protein
MKYTILLHVSPGADIAQIVKAINSCEGIQAFSMTEQVQEILEARSTPEADRRARLLQPSGKVDGAMHEFLLGRAIGDPFSTGDVARAFKKSKLRAGAVYSALSRAVEAGLIRRTMMGSYEAL